MKLKVTFLLSTLCIVIFPFISAGDDGVQHKAERSRFYVGSRNSNLKNPIFLCELDPLEKAIYVLDSFPAPGGAGYLALSPDGKYLYATSGSSIPGEEGSGSVASFRILDNHQLEAINRQSSKGKGNCHVSSSPDGKYVFAANYGSGHATVLPVDEEGQLQEATSVISGSGSGPNKDRQKGPHAHMALTDPSGNYLLVPDLGTDKVMNYRLKRKSGKLKANSSQPFLVLPPGSGPRHLAFHPSGKYTYILSEMSAILTACSFNAKNGVLEKINSASIVEEGFDGKRQSAAVRVHPNGKFVYATNRDDVSNLTVFCLNDEGGLEQLQIYKDIPYWPRDFNISPDGKYLVLAGARVNELRLYSIESETGLLTPTGASAKLSGPICVVFIP